jgi:hypothetical protein
MNLLFKLFAKLLKIKHNKVLFLFTKKGGYTPLGACIQRMLRPLSKAKKGVNLLNRRFLL